MLLTLYTEDYFDSAHFIENYDGKCAQLHGHTWKICVWVRGDDSLLENGILWDFGNLKRLTNEFDHKNLNEVLKINPTAENLVMYVYHKLKAQYGRLGFKVRIYEKIIKKESYCEAGDIDV
jgi:6-pyruvoyltetrahydropterin/6-carboxytetrahydropterin synthase